MKNQFEKTELDKIVDEFENMPVYDLDGLEEGGKLEVSTKNTTYVIERREDGLYISGHPEICPEPTRITNIGTKLSQGATSININKIVEGGYMEFTIPGRIKPVITTSEIHLVEEAE